MSWDETYVDDLGRYWDQIEDGRYVRRAGGVIALTAAELHERHGAHLPYELIAPAETQEAHA